MEILGAEISFANSVLVRIKSRVLTVSKMPALIASLRTIFGCRLSIGNCRNVRGLGKSMVVFLLFEKQRYSNERSTKFEPVFTKNRSI